MGESQNKILNGLPNTACLPRRKAGFFHENTLWHRGCSQYIDMQFASEKLEIIPENG